jgi:predicted HNH restriction endonuclease
VFDRRSPVKGERGDPWPHLISVEWDHEFPSVRVRVGDTQLYAVRPLSQNDQRKVDRARERREATLSTTEVIEGETLRREINFRRRNRALIEAKKAGSDYRCEVCGFSFEETYGPVGKAFIIAHHVEPLGSRRRASRTALGDIELICANCHAMIHKKAPPFLPAELRPKLNRN